MKKCITCLMTKGLDRFGKDSSTPDKLTRKCLECRRLYLREHNKANPEARRARERRYAEKYPDKIEAKQRRATLKQKGLTPDQYNSLSEKQEHKCAWCGTHKDFLIKPLFIDHDHSCCPGDKACGRCVRRLLCESCNQVEGKLLATWPEALDALNKLAWYNVDETFQHTKED